MSKIRVFYHDHNNFGWKLRYKPELVSPEEYVLVLSMETDEDIELDTVFAWMNAGSGEECKEFLADSQLRSLSSGDIVEIDKQKNLCMSVGWATL